MALVLVADDDEDIRDLVSFKLEQLGIDVISAADGSGALAAVRERGPDVAVLDISMPGMSGIDVCRAVRADPDLSATRVILLTARAQESDVETGFGSGADDYITKPFSPRDLATRVEALLSRSA